mgnify:CR=1 FL=1
MTIGIIKVFMKNMDYQKLEKYYHRPNDEVESLDFEYLEKFFRAFAYAAFLVADNETTPFWIPGDEHELAGKKLYNPRE